MTDNQNAGSQPPNQNQAGAPQPAASAPATPAAPGAPVHPPEEAAGRYFAEAIKLLSRDPVGNMKPAYDFMGPGRATGMGVILSVIFGICCVIGLTMWRKSAPTGNFGGFGGFGNTEIDSKEALSIVLVAGVIVLGLSLGSLVCRSMSRGGGGAFSQDIYVAGMALLPLAPCMIVAGYFLEYPIVVCFSGLFGGSFLVLTMYAAGTDVHGMTRRASSVMTPLVIMITAGAAYLTWKAAGLS